MTEETIRAIIETDHFDSTKIKKLLERSSIGEEADFYH